MSDPSNVQRPSVDDRPLSPHLMNYRLPMLPVTSILGRITGVGLAIGTLIVTWWLGRIGQWRVGLCAIKRCYGFAFGHAGHVRVHRFAVLPHVQGHPAVHLGQRQGFGRPKC